MVQETGNEELDRIPMVDPELEKERQTRREARRQEELNNPSMDKLRPIDPQTGRPVEATKTPSPMYPTNKSPRENVPMGGAIDD